MMNESVELIALIEKPAARRLWLLSCALQSLPFDKAIDLARAAEVFVTGSSTDNKQHEARIGSDPPVKGTEEPVDEISGSLRPVEEPLAAKHTRLALPTELRNRLLDRLAADAKNAELAAEFGLSSKQVQGIRMGCAREIGQRREQISKRAAQSKQDSPDIASIEEVVRYLRQQDDVVVPQQDGEFLVNGRFRMPFADLVARANRIRARQGKSKFDMPRGMTIHAEMSSANGHPLFWADSESSDGRR
jgi:hypothetical protein